jgi:hypothetical protein
MTDSTTISAAATASGVKAWGKTAYEKANQTSANATEIGWLRNNDSRLNVVSEMTQYDKQQVYKVKAVTDGQLGIGLQSDKDVRIQVYNAANQVVADSNPNMGKASENYTAMQGSNYAMKAGTYYVKVTRGAGVPATADVHYALQLKQGTTYKNDYVTTQVALTQDGRARAMMAQISNPSGVTTYTSAGTLLSESGSQQSGLLGGVSFATGGNIFGLSNTV